MDLRKGRYQKCTIHLDKEIANADIVISIDNIPVKRIDDIISYVSEKRIRRRQGIP